MENGKKLKHRKGGNPRTETGRDRDSTNCITLGNPACSRAYRAVHICRSGSGYSSPSARRKGPRTWLRKESQIYPAKHFEQAGMPGYQVGSLVPLTVALADCALFLTSGDKVSCWHGRDVGKRRSGLPWLRLCVDRPPRGGGENDSSQYQPIQPSGDLRRFRRIRNASWKPWSGAQPLDCFGGQTTHLAGISPDS